MPLDLDIKPEATDSKPRHPTFKSSDLDIESQSSDSKPRNMTTMGRLARVNPFYIVGTHLILRGC